MQLNIDVGDLTALKGKVAIITGGSSGIGLATVKLFSSQGALVTIADLRPPAEEVSNSVFGFCDVSQWDSILTTFETTIARHGAIDIVVANAGIGEVEDLFADELDDATGKLKRPQHRVLYVNLLGAIDSVKIAMHYMRKSSHGGSIILTTSSAGYVGEKGLTAYTTAKHGLVGFMRSLHTTLSHNITINAVAPYMTESGLMSSSLRSALTEAGIPINRPEKVALAIGWLALSEKSGQTIYSAGNTFTEVESGIRTSMPLWLGTENSRLLEIAATASLFGKGTN